MGDAKGFLGNVLWGFAVGIGGRVGWGIVGWLLGVMGNAVNN